ncbi:MAG: hypothetical protein AAB037_04000 [Chloroflexota bacterium]
MESKGNTPNTGPSSEQAGDLRERERQLIDELTQVRSQERSIEDKLVEIQTQEIGLTHKPNGAAAAAVLSSSFGVFVLGLLTTLAAASAGINKWLNWYDPTGPLSGKTTLAGIMWLVVWPVGHYWLRNKEVKFTRVTQVSIILIVVGLLLMFPPVFMRFE